MKLLIRKFFTLHSCLLFGMNIETTQRESAEVLADLNRRYEMITFSED